MIPGKLTVKNKLVREPRSVSAPRKVVNFITNAPALVLHKGTKFASEEIVAERDAVCLTCGYWKPESNLGFGECAHPSCGCTKFKRKLIRAACPLKLWKR